MQHQINYTNYRLAAIRLIRTGFGINEGAKHQTRRNLEKLGVTEVTQMIAVAEYLSQKNNTRFFSELDKEITLSKVGLNSLGKEVNGFKGEEFDPRNELKVIQLDLLYRRLGAEFMWKYLKPDCSYQQFRWWARQAFARRKDEFRPKRREVLALTKIMEYGGVIEFHETEPTLLIKNQEIEYLIEEQTETISEDSAKTPSDLAEKRLASQVHRLHFSDNGMSMKDIMTLLGIPARYTYYRYLRLAIANANGFDFDNLSKTQYNFILEKVGIESHGQMSKQAQKIARKVMKKHHAATQFVQHTMAELGIKSLATYYKYLHWAEDEAYLKQIKRA